MPNWNCEEEHQVNYSIHSYINKPTMYFLFQLALSRFYVYRQNGQSWRQIDICRRVFTTVEWKTVVNGIFASTIKNGNQQSKYRLERRIINMMNITLEVPGPIIFYSTDI
jgi:hypothetical protein